MPPIPDLEKIHAEFVETRHKAIPEQWNRLKWALERQIAILGIKPYRIERGVGDMIRSAAFCYFSGSSLGCVMLASAAMERTMRIITNSDEGVQFFPLICAARNQKKITDTMADELHEFRKTIRIPVTHAKTALFLGALGTTRRAGSFQTAWKAPPGRPALTVEKSARLAFEMALRLIKETST